MKQQISAHLAPIGGQFSAHLTPIDNQSQCAQTSAQIVRKQKYATKTLSTGYTYHPKTKKNERIKTGATGIFPIGNINNTFYF